MVFWAKKWQLADSLIPICPWCIVSAKDWQKSDISSRVLFLGFVSAPYETWCLSWMAFIDHKWGHHCSNSNNHSEHHHQHLIFIVLVVPEIVRHRGIEIKHIKKSAILCFSTSSSLLPSLFLFSSVFPFSSLERPYTLGYQGQPWLIPIVQT